MYIKFPKRTPSTQKSLK